MSKPIVLFVDDEPNVLNGLKRFCRSQRHEWEMHFFDGGETAIEFLEGNSADVVVSDMRMPGMNGADLFEQISTRWPGIIRIILSGEAELSQTIRTVGRSHRFLAKPCEPEGLINAINAPLKLRQDIGMVKTKQDSSYLDRLQTPATVFAQLITILKTPEVKPGDVIDLIHSDAGLTARILQLVNSAYFGRPVVTCNLARAVDIIGCDRLLELLERKRLGNHNVEAILSTATDAARLNARTLAQTCSELAQSESMPQGVLDLAYIAGLFAELGAQHDTADASEEENSRPVAPVAAYMTTLLGLPSYLSATLHTLSSVKMQTTTNEERVQLIYETAKQIENNAA